MKLYLAIDLRGGQAVRLYQGDYDQMTVYNADPVAQAKAFVTAGAKYLHVVDLDGAKDDTTADHRRHCQTGRLKDRGRRRHPGRGAHQALPGFRRGPLHFGHHRREKLCLYRRDGAEVRRTDCRGRRHEKRPGSRERLEGSYPRAGHGVPGTARCRAPTWTCTANC